MPARFDETLVAAVGLLRTLPRGRTETALGKAQFAEFRAAHPETPARLSIDARPGSPLVDYDVLLEHPAKGTVGLTWRADAGSPWSVDYADHWASNFVVTLGGETGESVSIQEALLVLELAAHREPDLMERIIEERLIATLVEADPPPVDDAELQEAADDYRATHDLLEPGSMRRQLDEWGITEARFAQMLSRVVQRRKLSARVTAGQVEPFFESHRAELDRLRVLCVRAPTIELLRGIEAAARGSGLFAALAVAAHDPGVDRVETELANRFAEELPPPIRTAPPRTLVAPFEHEGGYCMGELFDRIPAVLDPATHDHVERLLFRRFLGERRAAAAVQWHWL